MDGERIHIVEICVGLVSIVTGFVLYWWSMQLLWIAIYPPPLAKQIIGALPIVFWSIGVLLIMNGVRRTMRKERRK